MQSAITKTVERRAIRMHQMMERLRVDPHALIRLRNGEAYAEARSTCFRCEDSNLCLLWLDKRAPDVRPDFCPNVEFFNACKVYASRFSRSRRPQRSCWRKAKARGRRN